MFNLNVLLGSMIDLDSFVAVEILPHHPDSEKFREFSL